MNVSSSISIIFDVKDAETLFKKAVVDHVATTFGVVVTPDDLDITFDATLKSDQYDCGPGIPTFAGVKATIKQAIPKKEPVMPWHHGSCNRR